MNGKRIITIIKFITLFFFLVMVTVNVLANTIPINGVNTGQVSETYENLFAPASISFAIWGLIYFLLAAYTLYQLGFLQDKSTNRDILFTKIGTYFSISSFANTAWIFAWHYFNIPLSVILMFIILICLILIAKEINNEELTLREKFFIGLPFSVYFGWITVATIANVTVLLLSLGWNGFGIAENIWAAIMISVGLAIAVATMLRFKDFVYGLVIIWAYIGIIIKHTSESGFAGKYPLVIITAVISILLILIAQAYILWSKRQ